jgi:anaerobic selenocysteine-containing dehydrogenase
MPSGKLELYCERAAADGHDPLPGYTPRVEAAAPGEGRLALIAAASRRFLNSTFANGAVRTRRAGEPTVVLHPGDAAERGLRGRARARRQRARQLPGAAPRSATRRGRASSRRPRGTGLNRWPRDEHQRGDGGA